MATRYRLKRVGDTLTPQRQFSVLDSVGNVVGGAVKTTGDVMNSGLGKTAGFLGGAALGGHLIGKGLLGKGLVAFGASPITAPLAVIGGGILGAKLMKGAGKALHNAGNSLGA